MADTFTSILNLTKPEVGASTDTWGTKVNADLDTLDGLFQAGPALKLANGGTGATTAAGARTNLGLGDFNNTNGLGFRNRIINGDMRIDQRNAGASVAYSVESYHVDRWRIVGSITGSRTVVRASDGPSISTPFCLSVTQTGSNESTASADYCNRQFIELQNCYDLANKDVTVSFWYKSNRTGAHGVRLIGSYAAGSTGGVDSQLTFTVNLANTWEYKTITFTSLKNLTSWGTGASNAGGIVLDIGFRCATLGQPAVSVNDYFRITEVQLEAGTVASPFERRDYGRELMMCQRYYQRINTAEYVNAYAYSTNRVLSGVPYTNSMRTTPTASVASNAFVFYTASAGFTSTAVTTIPNTSGFVALDVTVSATAGIGSAGSLTSALQLSAEL